MGCLFLFLPKGRDNFVEVEVLGREKAEREAPGVAGWGRTD